MLVKGATCVWIVDMIYEIPHIQHFSVSLRKNKNKDHSIYHFINPFTILDILYFSLSPHQTAVGKGNIWLQFFTYNMTQVH